jgi:hypothetical protein
MGRRIHDLRHTAACLWLSEGVDPVTVQAWVGAGVRIRRGTPNDKERTLPLRWCFRWWDGVSVWWS